MPTAEKLFRVTGVPIMRTGSYRDSKGRPATFTRNDLSELASAYDPDGKHEARIKIGHDHDEKDPAHGYAEKLYTQGDFLLADYAAVPESKVQAFSKVGSHPRRSVEIINLNDESYIGDIGHFGAQRTAIKPLPAIVKRQVSEMTEEEIASLSEHAPIRGGAGGVMLFSEEADDVTLLEENDDMATAEVIKLTEDKAAAEQAALAEKAKRETAERELAEYKQKEAAGIEDKKSSDAEAAAKKFAEDHKKQLVGVPVDMLVAGLAFADTKCPKITFGSKEMGFGDFIREFMEGLPALPGRVNLGAGGKPEGETSFAEDDNSAEARDERIKKYAEQNKVTYNEAADTLRGGFSNA